jgi:hypothetical protein
MLMTEVTNLATGDTATYSLSPAEAVRAAHAQFDCGDYNWWNYDVRYPMTKMRSSDRIVGYGNWSAWKAEPHTTKKESKDESCPN